MKSFAFFPNDLDHDTGFVYFFLKELCKFICENFSFIKNIQYFSDGCSAQYKNYKIFFNLTFHQQDFRPNAAWNFFAKSHGKSPCDGLGGAIKRKLRTESLSRTTVNPIITAIQGIKFCKNSMMLIFFLP